MLLKVKIVSNKTEVYVIISFIFIMQTAASIDSHCQNVNW